MKTHLSFWGKAVTAVFLVLALSVLFIGCDPTTNGDPPQRFGPKIAGAELNGTWSSIYEDQFIIDKEALTFTYWYGAGEEPDYSGEESYDYAGNIVGEIASDPSLLQCEWGYITIQITNAGENGPTVNKYFVIRWKDLTASSVKEGGAYKAGGSNGGMDTMAEAEAEYTAENGYFGTFGTYSPVQ
jgi:hypothetical protein